MIMPIAFCLNCDRKIYDRWQDFDEDNEEEPQFCCKKCKEEFETANGKVGYWKQAY